MSACAWGSTNVLVCPECQHSTSGQCVRHHPGGVVAGALAQTVAERDRLQRYFNRFDAAITHHKRDAQVYDVPEVHDEALWAARDRILRDSAAGVG